MSRYPHKLYVSALPGNSAKDANGNWIKQTPVLQLVSECREEPNGSGRAISLIDGNAFVFSSKIYAPVLDNQIKTGSIIKVEDEGGNVIFTGNVVRRSDNSKHTQIWA